MDKRQAADQAHLRFRDERSDFLSLIALWQFFTDALADKLPHRRLVERCRAHFVSYLRLREWRDLHRQLSEQVAELGWTWSEKLPATVDAARYATIHRALLAGLLSNIGTKADSASPADAAYLGARGIKFFLHPGSGMAKKPPKWVLAAELTETTAEAAMRGERRSRMDRESRDASTRPISIRAGMPRAAKWRRERVALYGSTLVRGGASRSARSIPRPRAKSSARGVTPASSILSGNSVGNSVGK
jgi:HrpA-like RNA helicase